MKPFELRLAQEHARVSHYLKNLRTFIDDEARFNRLGQEHRTLVLNQADVMSLYVDILEQRMKLLSIPI